MKKLEITILTNGIKIRREADERFTAGQKHELLLALILACFLIVFIALITR